MQKRCFINSELRSPILQSSKVKRWDWSVEDKEYLFERKNLSPSILIIASREDGTASYFQNYVQERGYPVELMFIEDPVSISKFIHNMQTNLEQHNHLGIYYRGIISEDVKFNEIIGVLHDLLSFYPGAVVNRPSRLSLNYSKPLQMAAIARSQSEAVQAIPTFLSNFCTEINGVPAEETIVKSISFIRSEVVSLIDKRLVHKVSSLCCPVQLQPRLQGINIRAHVCGETVYAVRIHGNTIDYRYGEDLSMEEEELPKEVVAWCIESARREGLEFAGIDLIYQPARCSYWCLEINPSPGYSFFEQRIVDSGGQPVISKWLLKRLIG